MIRFGNHIFAYILIILFWISLISAFLFVPLLKRIFFKPTSINIYTWVEMFEEDTIAEFEQQTGIKVKLSYYEQSQELFAKLQLTNGKGYDLIMASDYMVDLLNKHNLIKKIDKRAFAWWDSIDPHLLELPYDPENNYTIPLFWDIYGIGYNKKFFKHGLPIQSWALVFNPALYGIDHISMIDEANEALLIATQYLYGKVSVLTQEQLTAIQQILLNQKKYVEAYTDLRAGYLLLSGTSPISVGQSAFVCKAYEEDPEAIGFIIPEEGSFITLDTIALPAQTKKDDLVYKFINFIYQKEVMKHVVKRFAYFPARKDVLSELDLSCLGGLTNVFKRFDKVQLFTPLVPLHQISHIWMRVKSF